ncbi:hypothetical protein BASA81_000416 [Batrachochytrium salamandrivorans]|nr:hypothetical protein BASA81_000416 [Batrachochytrium salamandrivorans]
MSLPGTSGQFSQHSDVLASHPETEEEIQSLVAELRRRGNLAFKSKSLMESDMLYTKAIEVFPKDASIYANRAAARLAMKNFKLALEDANAAVKIGNFPKAHFRRGQALAGLLRYSDAEEAFLACVKEDPANVEAQREADKMKLLATEQQLAASSTKKKQELDAPPPLTNPPPAAKKTKKKDATAEAAEDEEHVNESELMKGYKVLDNGKKTTFFHMDIAPEQKAKLDQANKPQALSQSTQVVGNSKAGSQWNSAGTFEEKDMTKFATEAITNALVGTSVLLDTVVVEVTNVSDFDGSASHTVIRGTRKTPFDFTFVVDWTAHFDPEPLTGKLFCSQCTNSAADLEVEFEVRWENRAKAGKHEAALLKLVKGELAHALEEKLLAFAKTFSA